MCFHIVRGVFYLFAGLTILFICNSNDTKPRETVKTSPASFQNPYDFNENELENLNVFDKADKRLKLYQNNKNRANKVRPTI